MVNQFPAPAYEPVEPELERPRRRARLLLVPAAVLLLLAVPGGAFAYAQNELTQAQQAEGQGQFAAALAHYQSADSIAGNPGARFLLGDLADRAEAGAAQAHYDWGQAQEHAGQFANAEEQYREAVASGIQDWQTRGNQALASLFLDWGGTLAGKQQFEQAIDKYRQVAAFDSTGELRSKTADALATAYAGYALSFSRATPADWVNALTWYQNLVKEFPDSAQAANAKKAALPQALYMAGLAYVQQSRYEQARQAMKDVIAGYPTTAWAQQAKAAMAAPQSLTGRLITGDGTPVGNRLLRISTHWRIVAPHTYDDSGGQHYTTTTKADGTFSLIVPPGQNYLVTWWDLTRKNFVTTFINDTVPVNQVNIDPLEPAHANVAIS